MSIGAFIEKPNNNIEGNFYTPIATEAFFKKCWMPAIEALNLQWLKLFPIGLSLSKENISNIVSELELLNKWVKANLNEEEQKHIHERITGLEQMLEKAIVLEDVIVFIG